MKRIIWWLKKKLGILSVEDNIITLFEDMQCHRRYVHETVESLKNYTRVDADIGFRGKNTIILTGVYKRQAYVHFYDTGKGEFEALVDQLRHYRTHALIRTIDAPGNFRGIFKI